jgi:S-adenosylmethionine:tRNA ribosyltransferase-isomerase
VRADALDYELPPELIAQYPAEDRESARIMYLPPQCGEPENRRMSELPELLPRGALVVVNDTRVIPARLIGRKRNSGGRAEILLVERLGMAELEIAPGAFRSAEIWRALGTASKGLRPGSEVEVHGRADREHANDLRITARVLRCDEGGLLKVGIFTPTGEGIRAALDACGLVPLPPYIRREPGALDVERYQTVYARAEGAAAAPTAGLHLTNRLLDRLVERGCHVASVTLHVGVGTFRPVTEVDLDHHRMHAERFAVPGPAAAAIAHARERHAPVVAVGTTTVRALETASDPERMGHVVATSGETQLLVQPGYRWRVVDALMTNFHLPRSTLLALVCAFGGTERVLAAYRTATRRGYRLLSYGDAMLLWRR